MRHNSGNPCHKCGGAGGRIYGSTTTWRGGFGGQAITYDVCDECWGSGDAEHHWADQRKMQARLAASEAACAQMRSALHGCNFYIEHYGLAGDPGIFRVGRAVIDAAVAALATDAGRGWVSTEGAQLGEVASEGWLDLSLPAEWAGREVYIILKPEDKP